MSTDVICTTEETARDLAMGLVEQAERAAARAEWEQARVLYTRAVAIDPFPASTVAFAVHLADRDQCDEALRLLERAWDQSRRLSSPRMRAVCCGNMAIVYRRLGNPAPAKMFHQLSLTAEMESPEFQTDASFTSMQRCESAAQWSDDGEHEWALKLLPPVRHTSGGDAGAAGDEVGRTFVDGDRAVIQARLGMIENALRGLFRVSRQHRRDGELIMHAHDLSNLGHLLQGIGRLPEAAWCFRISSRLFDRSGAAVRSQQARRFEQEARRRAALEASHVSQN